MLPGPRVSFKLSHQSPFAPLEESSIEATDDDDDDPLGTAGLDVQQPCASEETKVGFLYFLDKKAVEGTNIFLRICGQSLGCKVAFGKRENVERGGFVWMPRCCQAGHGQVQALQAGQYWWLRSCHGRVECVGQRE